MTTYNGPGTHRVVPAGVLLGFGNPLLDLVADVPKEFFDKYDVKPANAILAEEKHAPMYKELSENFDVKYVAGGATQNAIRAAQWLLRTKDATNFFGSVGKDEFANVLKHACIKAGVKTHYYETSEAPTGTCASLVLNSERSMVTQLAAANLFKYSHLESDEMKAVLDKAKVIYCGGFPLTLPEGPRTIQHLGNHCVDNGKIFCLNLAAPFIVDFFWEPLSEAIPLTDYIFCNENEAHALVKKLEWNCSLEEAALKLSAFPKASGRLCRTVVFTQGPDPTIVAQNGQVTLYPVPKLAPKSILDTTGAGDSFCGGFLARLCQGFDVPECVRAGHYAGRIVIQRSGCVFPEEPDI